MLATAIEACKETRYEFSMILALGYFGLTYLFENNTGQALDYFSQIVKIAYEKSNAPFKTFGIYYLTFLLFKQKHFHTAIQLCGTIEGLKTYPIVIFFEIPMVHNTRERSLLEAREALGETDYNVAYAEGRAMTFDQATAYALKALGQ